MNNAHFRTLIAGDSGIDRDPRSAPPSASRAPHSLGSRTRYGVPLTPRTVKGSAPVDIRSQVAERDTPSQTQRRFKSSAAPKGSKLVSGYTDRVLERKAGSADAAHDDRETRLRALEEQLRLGQLDLATFETQQEAITGGDITATHLVKGLDRKLLERVRRGEDVLQSAVDEASLDAGSEALDENRDDEFKKLEQREMAPVTHDKVAKKGEMAPPAAFKASSKRSRADLLAELKASRHAAQQVSAQSQLSSRFSKIGAHTSGSRVETDASGREVLITIDAEGRLKRKVKKPVASQRFEKPTNILLMSAKQAEPMGMVVPAVPDPELTEDDDVDIFDNVGSTYNPLGDDGDIDAGSSDDDADAVKSKQESAAGVTPFGRPISPNVDLSSPEIKHSSSISGAVQNPAKKNYFDEQGTTAEQHRPPVNPLHDPAVLAALKRAAALESKHSGESRINNTEHLNDKQKELLSRPRDRDLDDLDMGFGSSRFEDEEDDGESTARKKLSEWKGNHHDEDGQKKSPLSSTRKRGNKKRRGDKNSASDIFKVLEGRKARVT